MLSLKSKISDVIYYEGNVNSIYSNVSRKITLKISLQKLEERIQELNRLNFNAKFLEQAISHPGE